MKEQFVTYEIAVKLKELGFKEYCFCCYKKHISCNILTFEYELSESLVSNIFCRNFDFDSLVAAPLWQQVIDWLREKYNLHITITSQSQESWQLTTIQKLKIQSCLIMFISFTLIFY